MTDAWRRTTLCVVMRIVGSFEFLLSFLYIHYISLPEKQQEGASRSCALPSHTMLFHLSACVLVHAASSITQCTGACPFNHRTVSSQPLRPLKLSRLHTVPQDRLKRGWV